MRLAAQRATIRSTYIAPPSALTARTSHRVRTSGERDAVSDTVVLRFPAKPPEYRLSARKPKVGVVLNRKGDNWVVERVEEAKDGTCLVSLRPGIKPV
jgi:hypothetical protein